MAESQESLRDRMTGLWQALGAGNRATVLLVVGGIVAGVLFWFAFLNQEPDYSPLFTGLAPEDAGRIVERLDELGIPYRIEGQGSTITIPEEEVHKTRLTLASEGLPAGGVVGFEALENPPLGATDFDRRVQYLRALQGELTRTIQQIQGVRKARVHINLPEESLFVRDRKPASAAVLLELEPGRDLSAAQVRGVVHLVAASVEGLEPGNVTVLDQGGRILSSGASDGTETAALSGDYLRVQQDFQQQLQQNVQSLLEQVLGPGNVVTRVSAELNFDQQVIEKNLLEPVEGNEGFIQQIQELEEQFEGTGSVGGVPGGDSNGLAGPPTYGQLGGGNSTYSRTETTAQYDYNRTTTRTVIAPGAVKRLSVAVVVNRPDLTPEMEASIRQTVMAAVGLDENREDTITVSGMQFDTSLADAIEEDLAAAEGEPVPAQPAFSWNPLETPVTWALYGGALFFLLLLGVLLRVSAGRRERERRRLEEEALRRAEQEAALRNGHHRNGQAQETEGTRLRKQALQSAASNPEDVAQIVRSWLLEN